MGSGFYLRWCTFSTAKKRDLKTCKVPVWLTVLTKIGTQTVNIEGKYLFGCLDLENQSTFRQRGTWETENAGKLRTREKGNARKSGTATDPALTSFNKFSFLIKVDRGLAIFVTAYEVTFLGHLIAGCLKEIDQFGAHADINGCQVVFIAIEPA